jgi:hypothetical protein
MVTFARCGTILLLYKFFLSSFANMEARFKENIHNRNIPYLRWII